MKKLFVLSLIITACSSSKNEGFCDCLQKTESLNEYQSTLLSSDALPSGAKDSLQLLTESKDKACKEFASIDGQTASKLKEECEAK